MFHPGACQCPFNFYQDIIFYTTEQLDPIKVQELRHDMKNVISSTGLHKHASLGSH